MFQGLEEYLESLYDNGIGMLSATRLIGANKTTPVVAAVGLPAIKYGEPIYIYTVLAINIIVIIAQRGGTPMTEIALPIPSWWCAALRMLVRMTQVSFPARLFFPRDTWVLGRLTSLTA
ncbi:hypothetical protein DM02DRAFT_620627 [Periconia macrospinosa]|uniref:Uncharacterized protein n=1 Tax=Periconia macrospinosa TaxID=97972 RepID=A0A2V1D1V3_9PLEO|nr:hypothetical protein DM02DRAFT_620627 [Periconia macrospinosa]